MEIRLHPKQEAAFQTEATELLYGGAAGGGKSHFLRISAIRWAMIVPGIQVYLFRRTFPDLQANHLRGPSSLLVLLGDFLQSGHVKFTQQDNEFKFWNGSSIKLCHCQHENDVIKYQGAEIHVLLMDELTHFTAYIYQFLRSRVRMAGLDVPDELRGLLPRIECGSNPGSVGHAWVKATFVSPCEPMKVWRAPAHEGGMLRQYIPARLSDNPTLAEGDPNYLSRLEGLGTPELVRAMRDGDWDIVAGQAFEKLNRDIHGLTPFEIPAHWLRFRAMDWGSSKPFSVGWWCVASEDYLHDGKVIPKGALIRYREWYGWNGQADTGLRMESAEVAQQIKVRDAGDKITYSVADPAIWNRSDGPSVAERMAAHGVIFERGNNDRINGYLELRQRIAGDGERPMLYAFTSCHDGFWRTMPNIVMDDRRPEDIDTTQEDHCADECKYAAMSRPWVKPSPKPKEDPFRPPTINELMKLNRRKGNQGRQWI